MKLYITADQVGVQTGGGLVTQQEFQALQEFPDGTPGGTVVITPWSEEDKVRTTDPFDIDFVLKRKAESLVQMVGAPIAAHCYSGCLTSTITFLKSKGIPVTYTAAAHDVDVSRKEHEALGIPFNYPHLTNPNLWQAYLKGYLLADRVITPSTHSANVMAGFGVDGSRIKIIPHGVHIPEEGLAPYPSVFTVGYLGAYGPDKGVRYLLEAWKRLAYRDAALYLAGRDSLSPFVSHLIEKYGGGCIIQVGWVPKVADFYNQLSLYIQASASEGFGCEVLEAMSFGRPVLCSTGAGASDCVLDDCCFAARDTDDLVTTIRSFRGRHQHRPAAHPQYWRELAQKYAWDKIRTEYHNVWKELLNG